MGLLDKFLDAIKLNDDYDDDEEFFDDDEELEDDFEDEKPKRRFFKKSNDSFDDYDDDEPIRKTVVKETKPKAKPVKAKPSPKVTPIRSKKGGANMEVNVIRPTSMEDTREIADTLLDSCTVVLNLEGLDVDIAQRIIDFTCGSCYSLGGSLQKISSYIFILTPANVDISGDFQDILNGAFDIPSMRNEF
ncbi:MAG: cell division protein SepF [Lachnospiraceae bacterium]|nr:cell division protein SepF [Lachnospiraceae bacterium]